MKLENANILLSTSAQVYPNITSWNASTGLANDAVEYLYKLSKSSPKIEKQKILEENG